MPFKRYMRVSVPLLLPAWLLLFCFFPLFSIAQVKTVTGIVKDDSNNPIAGVSVVVKNNSTGTRTNDKGFFSIHAAAGATLVFSSLGYDGTEVVVDDRNEYNVTLVLKPSALTDVVVVGYGKQKKVNLVG